MHPAQIYVFGERPNLFRNTILISIRFFAPIWSIAAVFTLPTFLFFDFISSLNMSNNFLIFATLFVWISSYFASFVIAAEVSDICLGGTTSFSKAMYKTSVRGVGRLLGTDLIVGVVAILVFFILEVVTLLVAFVFDTNSTLFALFLFGGIVLAFTAAALVIWLFLFTVQIAAIERIYWLSSLKRSASIVLRSKRRSSIILLKFLCLIIILQSTMIASTIAAHYLVGNLPQVLNTLPNQNAPRSLVVDVFGSILYTLYMPIPTIFLTLAYYYLRRADGKISTKEIEDIKAYEMS